MKRKQELGELLDAFGRYVAEAHANPERIACPDESSLRNLANYGCSSEEVTALLDHVGSCAQCLEELKRDRSA
jgi:hypothetical protein